MVVAFVVVPLVVALDVVKAAVEVVVGGTGGVGAPPAMMPQSVPYAAAAALAVAQFALLARICSQSGFHSAA